MYQTLKKRKVIKLAKPHSMLQLLEEGNGYSYQSEQILSEESFSFDVPTVDLLACYDPDSEKFDEGLINDLAAELFLHGHGDFVAKARKIIKEKSFALRGVPKTNTHTPRIKTPAPRVREHHSQTKPTASGGEKNGDSSDDGGSDSSDPDLPLPGKRRATLHKFRRYKKHRNRNFRSVTRRSSVSLGRCC